MIEKWKQLSKKNGNRYLAWLLITATLFTGVNPLQLAAQANGGNWNVDWTIEVDGETVESTDSETVFYASEDQEVAFSLTLAEKNNAGHDLYKEIFTINMPRKVYQLLTDGGKNEIDWNELSGGILKERVDDDLASDSNNKASDSNNKASSSNRKSNNYGSGTSDSDTVSIELQFIDDLRYEDDEADSIIILPDTISAGFSFTTQEPMVFKTRQQGNEFTISISDADKPQLFLSGVDRSSEFEMNRLLISVWINGVKTIAYEKGNDSLPSFTEKVTYNSLEAEIDLNWQEIASASHDYSGNDYIIFDICKLECDPAIVWKPFTELPLVAGGKHLGTAKLVMEKDEASSTLTATVWKLSYMVTFADEIKNMTEVEGAFTGKVSVKSDRGGDKFKIIAEGESGAKIEYEIEKDKVDPTGWRTNMPSLSKFGTYNNEGNKVYWNAMLQTHKQLEQYFAGTAQNGTDDLVFIDKLDQYQTFYKPNNNVDIRLRIPIFILTDPLITNDMARINRDMYYILSKAPNEAIRYITPDAGDPSITEAYVKSTSKTWTIITEPDGCEKLILNVGPRGGSGIKYNDLISWQNGIQVNFADIVQALKDDRDQCAANKDAAIGAGKNDEAAQWQAYEEAYGRSIEFYKDKGDQELYYLTVLMEAYVKTNMPEIADLDSIVNSYQIIEGSELTPGTAEIENSWIATIKGKAKAGDIQVFKADSRYANEINTNEKPKDEKVNGPLPGVGFEIYVKGETVPLTFAWSSDDGVYLRDTTTSGTRLETNTKGTFVVRGLTPGVDYILKEIDPPAGYYYENIPREIEFIVSFEEITYRVVENTPRAVELKKIDAGDHTSVLSGAVFELYMDLGNPETDTLVSGFDKKTIDGTLYYAPSALGSEMLITGSDGMLRIAELPAGKYYLKEVTAPTGYQCSDQPYRFELNDHIVNGIAVYSLGDITNTKETTAPTEVTADIEAKKSYNRELTDDQFEFMLKLTSAPDGSEVKAGTEILSTDSNAAGITAANKNHGGETSDSIRFVDITFDTIGEYVFELSEVNTVKAGVAYDGTVYYVKVTVTEPAGNGILQATVEYYTNAECTEPVGENVPVFHNTYTPPEPVTDTIRITAEKELTGRALTDREFAFTAKVIYHSTAWKPDDLTAYNDGSKKVEFSAVKFTEEGVYVYEISEDKGVNPDPSIQYSQQRYYAKVVVKKNAAGEIGASLTYGTVYIPQTQEVRGDIGTAVPVFTNTVIGNLNIKKVSVSGNRPLSGAEFALSCRIKGSNDEYTPYGGVLVTSGTNGMVSLKLPENFAEYEYRLTETKAPNGYSRTRVGTILFTMLPDGTIDSLDSDGVDGYVLMSDDKATIIAKNHSTGGGGGGGNPPGPRPTDPTTPAEPTQPGNPENPTDPADPEQPGNPPVVTEIPPNAIPYSPGTPIPEGKQVVVFIGDDGVPGAYLVDLPVPLGGLPRTGDEALSVLWLMVMMLTALSGFCGVIYLRRTNRKKNR